MKLTDLDPRWVTWMVHAADGVIPPHNGVSFLCPHCHRQRLVIHFTPQIDPQGILSTCSAPPATGKEWQRQGETFDTLTLTPSIDASFHGHWHGFIQNGEIK